jgi:histidinol-phosphate aminotransferase
MTLRVPDHIQALQPYKPGKSIQEVEKTFSVERWIKLASNENPRGMAPLAVQGLQDALAQSHIYPHPRSPKLLEALSKQTGLTPDQLIATNGVDSLLAYIFMTFASSQTHLLTSEGSFIGTYVNAQKLNISVDTVPLKDYGYDLDGMLQAIGPDTGIIYLANPNNPTGTPILKDELTAFLQKVPQEIVVVLDEAYFEYAKDFDDYPDGVALLSEHKNLIVTRTMSKAYGMAGLRVGYGMADASIITQVQKVKLPFEPSGLSQAAATSALQDEEFLQETINLNREAMMYFVQEFERLSLNFVRNSYANFFMLVFDDDIKAEHFTNQCLERGLILRHLDRFGLPQCVRINTGTMEENKLAIAIIESVLGQANVDLLK